MEVRNKFEVKEAFEEIGKGQTCYVNAIQDALDRFYYNMYALFPNKNYIRS